MSKQATLSSLFWTGSETAILQVLRLFVSMVLARLLTPADFGLIALISVFIAIADKIASGGLGNAIVVFPDLKDIDCSTAFVYNLVVSCTMYLIIFASAPFIAAFYNEPQLVSLIRVLSLVNLIHAGSFVQGALLCRRLQFKFVAFRNISATIVSGLIAILMAFLGFGVWSLVAMTLSRALINNVLMWMNKVWKFSLRFSWESFRKSFSFSSRMLLTVVSGVIFNNLNNLLIGKFYSQSDLGLYYQAQKLKNLPVEAATGVVSKVSNPLLAKYQNDLPSLHKTYFHLVKIAAFLIIPFVTLMLVVSYDLIVVMFSSGWVDSVPIFRIIIPIGWFLPFVVINGLSPVVMGNSKYYLYLDAIAKAIYLVVIFVALRFGLMVFIASQTMMMAVQMIVNAFVARKFFKVGVIAQIKAYLPYYLYSAIAGISVWLIGYLPWLISVTRLPISIAVFTAVYVGLVYYFERRIFNQVRDLISERIFKLRQKLLQGT